MPRQARSLENQSKTIGHYIDYMVLKLSKHGYRFTDVSKEILETLPVSSLEILKGHLIYSDDFQNHLKFDMACHAMGIDYVKVVVDDTETN